MYEPKHPPLNVNHFFCNQVRVIGHLLSLPEDCYFWRPLRQKELSSWCMRIFYLCTGWQSWSYSNTAKTQVGFTISEYINFNIVVAEDQSEARINWETVAAPIQIWAPIAQSEPSALTKEPEPWWVPVSCHWLPASMLNRGLPGAIRAQYSDIITWKGGQSSVSSGDDDWFSMLILSSRVDGSMVNMSVHNANRSHKIKGKDDLVYFRMTKPWKPSFEPRNINTLLP